MHRYLYVDGHVFITPPYIFFKEYDLSTLTFDIIGRLEGVGFSCTKFTLQ